MATYLYSCEVHGEMEIDHSINEKLTFCPECKKDGKKKKIKRLIAGNTSFELKGSCWAKDLYK